MSAAKERALAKRAQAGSPAAARDLADSNVRLVVLLVGKVHRPEWIEIDDLVQEGTLGLMHAIGLFNPSLGRFRPYAARWIRDYAIKFVERGKRRACEALEGVLDQCDIDGNPAGRYNRTPVDPALSPEAAYMDAEASVVRSRAVTAAIATLGPQEAVAVAGEFAGMTQVEIARREKRTKQNVSEHQRSARPRLARILRKDRRLRSIFA